MRNNPAEAIERWFKKHDDGEFVFEHRPVPYAVIGPSRAKGRIVFATKPRTVEAAIEASAASASVGLIGRYGLPCRSDLAWIRAVVGNHALFFLGDMDPVDLMIFCWLRARLRPKRIEHLGVSDAYLRQLGVQLPESFIIPCSKSERQSLPVLQRVFPTWRKTVGPQCASLLESGKKIELEGVVSALHGFAPILKPLASRKGRMK